MDLHLKFERERIDGGGTDDIGFFTIRGTYDDESLVCRWLKTYPGSHDVVYRGWREGKGIWGHWHIDSAGSGGFLIWPKSAGEGEAARAGVDVEEPVEAVAKPPMTL